MYVANGLAALLLFVAGIVAVRNGHEELLFPGMIVLSPVAMLLLRWWYEDGLDRSFFNPLVMSWGFILGDTVILPVVLLFGGLGWQDLPNGWRQSASLWFAAACALIGLAVAVVFRLVDGRRYVDAGVPTALLSPTKVWHDWVVMPVTVAGLCWLLIPQVYFGGSTFTRPAFVFMGLFGLTLLLDAITKPDPAAQHPQWDSVRFTAV
jgi:hypothetical protein